MSDMQSAFARHVLNRQMGAVALLNSSEMGKTETDIIFNDGKLVGVLRWLFQLMGYAVWANNGDAISRA
jgi:hypothetical protein